VPLSTLALGWLSPGGLTVARFALAAPVLGVVGRRGLREALTPAIAAAGALGFGAVIGSRTPGSRSSPVTAAAALVDSATGSRSARRRCRPCSSSSSHACSVVVTRRR
jgi:hypothetical protein